MTEVIVADIGGTHTRLGLWTPSGLSFCEKQKTAEFDTVPDLLNKFKVKHALKNTHKFAFATAGSRFADETWRIRNAENKTFGLSELKSAGYEVLISENDFVATAHGCLNLPHNHNDRIIVKNGKPMADAATIVMGPGTGLGLAYGFIKNSRFEVHETHGAHMLFTPVTEVDFELSRLVAKKLELNRPVIFEDMTSGSTFSALYESFCSLSDEKPNKHFFDDTHQKSFCMALSCFHRYLGLFTHLSVLTIHGYGGVIMNGGFLDALIDRNLWNAQEFINGFHQPGVPIIEHDIGNTPVSIVKDTYISLYGLGKMLHV